MEEKLTIHTEGTPNPNALKFVVNKAILQSETYNFPNKEKAANSPLALKLFEVNSVKEVFIGKDFITISKDQNTNWDNVYNQLVEIILNHLNSNEPLVLKTSSVENKSNIGELEKKILEILDSQIRPAVASDGGDVIFDSFKDGILRLHLQGACSHCPSSIMTLKAGIESMLKRQIPEIKEVISI